MTDLFDPYEKYSRFVADWDRYVAPWRSQTLEYAKLSVEYGKLALQSAFILNGGAMVALAPLIQNQIDTVQKARASAVWFVIGLMAAALATFFAYYNFTVIGEQCGINCDSQNFDLKKNYGYDLTVNEEREHAKLDSKWNQRRKIIIATMVLAILSGFASYGAFCWGAFLLA